MNKFLIILISLLMCSCASEDHTKYFHDKIRKELKDKYSIPNGEVVAKFDLGGIESRNSLFASYYGKSISLTYDNRVFLNEFAKSYRLHKNKIESNSQKKFHELHSLLLVIQKKYGALSSSAHKKLLYSGKSFKKQKHNLKKLEYFTKLAELHNISKNIPLLPPVDRAKVTSNFGPRIHPKTKKKSFHKGLDMCGIPACVVRASGDGVVEEVSRVKGYGNNVTIRHSDKILTRYAHLSKINIKQGQKVILGQKIGHQGLSGTTKGEHLHFEIIINKKPVNPKDFIAKSI